MPTSLTRCLFVIKVGMWGLLPFNLLTCLEQKAVPEVGVSRAHSEFFLNLAAITYRITCFVVRYPEVFEHLQVIYPISL